MEGGKSSSPFLLPRSQAPAWERTAGEAPASQASSLIQPREPGMSSAFGAFKSASLGTRFKETFGRAGVAVRRPRHNIEETATQH